MTTNRLSPAARRVEEVKRIAQSEAAKAHPDLALVAIVERRSFSAFVRQVDMLRAMRGRK